MTDKEQIAKTVDEAIHRPRKKILQPQYSKEQLKDLADAAYSRKMEAVDEEINLRPDNQWDVLSTNWHTADDKRRKDIVFGLAYYSGFKSPDICRLFRIKPAELVPYKDIIEQGRIALKFKITSNQIAFGLLTDQPVVKFHLGKQFAEQVDNPVHEGVESLDRQAPTIIIQEASGTNTELRAELEDAVRNAQAQGGRNLSVVK